jgi:hypothetical protein
VSTPRKWNPALLAAGLAVLVLAAVAVLKRDAIAGMILKGGDATLMGEDARTSAQAALAMEFLAALRASDMAALERLATAEQVARIQQEAAAPTEAYQQLTGMMLEDLPADAGELRALIKSVQTHKQRSMVTFETRTNSWFVTMDQGNDPWRVAGF